MIINSSTEISETYPLDEEYKLYELDGTNCLRVTGMSYNKLRFFASEFQNPDYKGRQDQNAPYWDEILMLSARLVWSINKKLNNPADAIEFALCVKGF